jgi:hypothetical protein
VIELKLLDIYPNTFTTLPLILIVTNSKEEGPGVIDQPEDDFEVVEKMLSFPYTSDYDKPATPVPSTTTPTMKPTSQGLQLHANVYIVAEKYDVSALKIIAANKYKERLKNDWSVISSSFIATLKLIYNGLPKNDDILKPIALEYAAQNAPSLAESAEYEKLCKKRGDIALDVFKVSTASANAGSKTVAKKLLPRRLSAAYPHCFFESI